MAKVSGLGASVAVDNSSGAAKTISNDVTDYQFSTPRGVQETTGVDKSAMERLLLLADYSNTLNGVFNATTDFSHDVFKTVPSTSVNRTTTIISGATMACEVLYSNYAITRTDAGELTWSASGSLADGAVPTWA